MCWRKTDVPHFQWSDHKKYTDADILAERYPPAMPLYREEVKQDTPDIKDVEIKIGSAELPGKLIDGVTYITLRDAVTKFGGEALAVTWDKAKGADVELK